MSLLSKYVSLAVHTYVSLVVSLNQPSLSSAGNIGKKR